MKKRSSLFLLAGISLIAGCTAPASGTAPVAGAPASPAVRQQCDAAAAGFVVGQPLTPQLEAAARSRAGAALVRVIQPGQAVTMEFNEARLNLEVDARKRVKQVRCG